MCTHILQQLATRHSDNERDICTPNSQGELMETRVGGLRVICVLLCMLHRVHYSRPNYPDVQKCFAGREGRLTRRRPILGEVGDIF